MASVAEQLSRAREARNLSIADVVEMTGLKTDQVQALESSDWSAFAAPVYMRGFAKSYAGVLKLNAEELLAELDAELGQAHSEKAGVPNDVPLRAGFIDGIMLYFSHVKWRAVIPVLLLLVLAVGGYFGVDYYRNYKSADPLKGLGTGLNSEPIVTQADRLPLEPAQ
jgi:cytoskeletal protein RodZ